MVNKLGAAAAATFAALGLLHIYWALGGGFGSGSAVPIVGGKRVFEPSPAMTLLVAVALFAAMLVILGQMGVLGNVVPRWIFRWATWGIALVFLLRALGNFRTIGFFKQVHATPFAYWDTRIYSPLCLAIAVVAALLAYKKP